VAFDRELTREEQSSIEVHLGTKWDIEVEVV
jgi:hypothetical protein